MTGAPVSASFDLVQVVSETGTDAAIEFYHGGYDHYFVTSLPDEVAKLDAGVLQGWRRTGRIFSAWPTGTAQKKDVCRFWSGQRFAPKSSHVYTPYAQECADLKANPDWTYEGSTLSFAVPDASGICPSGTQILYRDYNNGQGGAPNHRIYTDVQIRAGMASRGWIAEGNGATQAFACVP